MSAPRGTPARRGGTPVVPPPRDESAPWPWFARLPIMLMGFSAAAALALAAVYLLYGLPMVPYAAMAVMPGNAAALAVLFAASLRTRQRVLLVAAGVLGALVPLVAILVYLNLRPMVFAYAFWVRVGSVAAIIAVCAGAVTGALILIGVFGRGTETAR